MDYGRIRAELVRRLRESRTADVLAVVAQDRIRNRGADIGGYADLWADKAEITVTRKKQGKVTKERVDHYRRGGTPLYDTGNLFRSLKGVTKTAANSVQLKLQGSLVALLQSRGFKTSGPNWIPFTKKAEKQMAQRKGGGKRRSGTYPTSNPDGLYVGTGVTVPARPLFAWPAPARQIVARAIAQALGAR